LQGKTTINNGLYQCGTSYISLKNCFFINESKETSHIQDKSHMLSRPMLRKFSMYKVTIQ